MLCDTVLIIFDKTGNFDHFWRIFYICELRFTKWYQYWVKKFVFFISIYHAKKIQNILLYLIIIIPNFEPL